jgi:two-component system sensor histidine kinase/response regulator
MQEIEENTWTSESADLRTKEIFAEQRQRIFKQTDRLFAGLMGLQWLAGIAAAYLISPKTWAGQYSQTHIHVWTAIFLGGAISIFPIILAVTRPGEASTRYTIAVAQMTMSGLLIHLTGGRIETHFHVFGSLAFLAFYRDWRTLVPATLVVAADHIIRGVFWPQSVYGVLTASEWRWVEHAGWVVFEDVFLVISCLRSVGEMWAIAERQARLESANETVQAAVVKRTAELKSSEERYRAVVQQVGESILLVDAGTKRILECNAAFQHLVGYTAEEVLALTIHDMLPEDPEVIDFKIRTMLEEKSTIVGERRYRRKDGSLVDVDIHVTAISYDGKEVLCSVVRDVTARKQAEDALAQARDAAIESARLKSEFLANMSHEIRTPMNGIIGMTELALDTELSAEQREYLDLVRLSADSLLGVINDILDFSKIEAGKLEIDSVGFSLEESMDAAVKPLALRAHQKGLEMVCQVDPEVPDALVGDPGRLRQILVNLIGNAVKFTECGEIVVQIEKQRQTSDEVWLHFTVSDTGIGIPAEKQSAIFDAFTQADSSTTRKYGGTGLGLSISAQLVRMMQGRIWIESPASPALEFQIGGPGSAFHFTLRFGLQEDEAPKTTPAPIVDLALAKPPPEGGTTNPRLKLFSRREPVF